MSESRHEIEQVLIRYALACDTRKWALMDEVFLPEATANYGGEYQLHGRDAIVSLIRSQLDPCGPTQHLLGNFRITITDQQAECRCYVRAAHAGRGAQRAHVFEVWAEYRDQLIRTDDGWRIQSRRMIIFNQTGDRALLGG